MFKLLKMSTIIKFDLKELRKLSNDKASCIVENKVTQNLAIQPWCLGNLTESIKNVLDYKIGKFDKKFNGILLCYKNLRVLQNVGAIRNDNADIHFQIQADYFIFQPHVGAILKGIVNKKSITHLAILLHRVFNVVIPRPTEEPGNEWIGTNIEEGQEVVFEIVVLDLYGALPYIRGKLDERWIKKFGPDGDDETVPKTIKVSYVNFDKTKPTQKKISEKHIGDGMSHSLTKKNETPSKKSSKKKSLNGQNSDEEIDTSIVEKSKKRQNKLLDSPEDPNKQLKKKHKDN